MPVGGHAADPRPPDAEGPYLSVIAASRNDEHGGNLLGRTQVFVEAWLSQAKRHNISSELILVEWNPPRDRERLAKALRWPADTGPCRVRIIEVPPHIHARYLHGDNLPLYQMIGKNAGIRRARGKFLVLTNIDIVFSDELCQFLAARKLESGKMYRIDRTDVGEAVPVGAAIDDQLAYCRSHVLRLYSREGVYPVTAEGFREIEQGDIVRPDGGVHLGAGWFPIERPQTGAAFRWMDGEAEILIDVPGRGAVLELEVEPGPGAGLDPGPKELAVIDWNGAHVATWMVSGRDTLHLVIPPPSNGKTQCIRLRVPKGGTPLPHDHRILDFRIFRCELAGFASWKSPGASSLTVMRRSRPTLARFIQAARASGGALGTARAAIRLLRRRGADIFETGVECRLGHGWLGVEDAELEKYRWVSKDVQLMARVGPNQGFAIVLEPGPALGFQPFTLVVSSANGQVLRKIAVNGVTYAEFSVAHPAGSIVPLVFSTEGGGAPTGEDPRPLSFRVFGFGHGTAGAASPSTAEREEWIALTVDSIPAEIDWASTYSAERKQIEAMGKPAYLHTYACGDFTMMAREHWFDVRGYIEFDGYSMHMDSMLCYAAEHAGAREELLRPPMRVYHIEHGIGSGWSPEGQNHLFNRLSAKGISWVSNEDIAELISHMRNTHTPVIFNPPAWGLADDELPEIEVARETEVMAGKV
jgi:hypothetical protein